MQISYNEYRWLKTVNRQLRKFNKKHGQNLRRLQRKAKHAHDYQY